MLMEHDYVAIFLLLQLNYERIRHDFICVALIATFFKSTYQLRIHWCYECTLVMPNVMKSMSESMAQ